MEGTTQRIVSAPEWLARCCARIAELDPAIAAQDVLELGQALADRPSCRALSPERAAELLFQNQLNPSRWSALDDDV
jgi:hypothetical protein